jgi:hypothetical protein
MAIIGTTIRIQGVFTDLSGQAADLDDTPVLIIYDSNKNIVDGPLNCTRSEAGTYIIDYVVPEGDGTLFLEMSGMLEGNPIISRQEIEREWDDDDGQTKLSVSDVITSVDAVKPNAYSRLYELYVISQINFHDGEYDSFANSMVMFNSTLDDYAKHYHRTKIPARQTGFINVWG